MLEVKDYVVFEESIYCAIRGARNSYNSWDKSDTYMANSGVARVGSDDMKLMVNLVKAGPSHRKFLRQIFVSVDINAPLYWWKEFDQYKVDVTSNSCSTMHTIMQREFTEDMFSLEELRKIGMDSSIDDILTDLNYLRDMYLDTKNKNVWKALIQLLPSSFNQLRTVTISSENVINIIKHRKEYKLNEWEQLIDVLMQMPLIKEVVENR